jgi:FAD/FMN-containing dehydrogenase
MGARGSCTIGGNIATNAGGNRVIRYGMMRDLVLGLEVVLADGTLLHGLRKLVKNNTGYDLKQLFVGSEGTLGVITRAVLKLSPKPASQNVALCALPGFDEVVRLLHLMRRRLPGSLSAFEVMWNGYYKLVVECVENVSGPFEPEHPYYVLVESLGADAERDTAAFEDALSAAFEEDLLVDAALSKSPAEVRSLWSLRDASLEVHRALGAWQAYDISLAIEKMELFAGELMRRLDAAWPGHRTVLFGHLGDGNLHVQTNAGGGHGDSDGLIYALTGEHEGSISAEHGIGYAKKRYLHHSRTDAEIALMARVKNALDPRGILNPGRIFNGAATS